MYQLSDYLCRYYGKKVIILLDEYDTPMQEAYVNGFWDELVAFTRSLFNSTFKTNPRLERAIMTGITRVSKESIFSDLNNLKVVTTTSDEYATSFGFTEDEVFAALDECGLSEEKGRVRQWYNRLNGNEQAVWSLLLASGYLKVLAYEQYGDIPEGTQPKYQLSLTNLEVKMMFVGIIHDWFSTVEGDYNDFISAILQDDIDAMNVYMKRVTLGTFSYFDTGERPSGAEPERFYHGFVLGLLVDLQDRYVITSNRESGFGRYDVVIEPKNPEKNDAYILEFKVFNPARESSLEDTAAAALRQIEEKQYAAGLNT